MLSVVFKFFKSCCGITACSYRVLLPTRHGGAWLTTPLFPINSTLFHGFIENHFLIVTVLGVCLFLLTCIQIPYSQFSLSSLHITHLYTDFFSLFSRIRQVPFSSKGLCLAVVFLILSLQVSQIFWSLKFFTLYQI